MAGSVGFAGCCGGWLCEVGVGSMLRSMGLQWLWLDAFGDCVVVVGRDLWRYLEYAVCFQIAGVIYTEVVDQSEC